MEKHKFLNIQSLINKSDQWKVFFFYIIYASEIWPIIINFIIKFCPIYRDKLLLSGCTTNWEIFKSLHLSTFKIQLGCTTVFSYLNKKE